MSGTMSGQALPAGLLAAIARLHAAMGEVANGDTSGIKALYAHSSDALSFRIDRENSMPVGRIILLVLEVEDVTRALAFYRDLLGIPLRHELDHGVG